MRLKYSIILAFAVVNGVALLAWTMDWFTVTVTGTGTTADNTLQVSGTVAGAGVNALAFAGLALALALTIAGPFFRVILGLLGVLIGVSFTLAGVLALANPISAVSSRVAEGTGITGSRITDLVSSITPTPWPAVIIFAGLAEIALSVIVLMTMRRWPASTRRYQPVRFQNENPSPAESAVSPSGKAVDEWDELTQGHDPTT